MRFICACAVVWLNLNIILHHQKFILFERYGQQESLQCG